jgi:hypothetical protein
MSAVLIAVVVLAGVACPLHMWWSHRRGGPGCLPAGRGSEGDLNDVRTVQHKLERSIAELAAQSSLQAPRARRSRNELPDG